MFSEGCDKRIKEIAFVQGETFFPLSFPLSFPEARVEEAITSARGVYLAIGIIFSREYFSHSIHSLSNILFYNQQRMNQSPFIYFSNVTICLSMKGAYAVAVRVLLLV